MTALHLSVHSIVKFLTVQRYILCIYLANFLPIFFKAISYWPLAISFFSEFSEFNEFKYRRIAKLLIQTTYFFPHPSCSFKNELLYLWWNQKKWLTLYNQKSRIYEEVVYLNLLHYLW